MIYIGDKELKQRYIGDNEVSKVYIGEDLVWEAVPPYLTFSSSSSFTLATKNARKNWDGTLEYSNDAQVWTVWDGTTSLSALNDGNKYSLFLRGTGNSVVTGNTVVSGIFTKQFVINGTAVSCSGNIETLLDYASVSRRIHPTMGAYCFMGLFYKCTALISAPDLLSVRLPETCYRSMFEGCTSLVLPPKMLAFSLAPYCCSRMFYGCNSLTTAPFLPALTMDSFCYSAMFMDCTSLVSAPLLRSTALAPYCYGSMFSGCANLTNVQADLPATILQNGCYTGMFKDCTSLQTPPSIYATVLAQRCCMAMFSGCSELQALPKLFAKQLESACYFEMFKKCTKIKLSKTLTGNYSTEYRIPYSNSIDDGSIAESALYEMFAETGGTFTDTPSINTIYYTSNKVI